MHSLILNIIHPSYVLENYLNCQMSAKQKSGRVLKLEVTHNNNDVGTDRDLRCGGNENGKNVLSGRKVIGEQSEKHAETVVGFIDSPSTGRKLFRLEINVPEEFDIDSEVTVKPGNDGRSLTVHGCRLVKVGLVGGQQSHHDQHPHQQPLQQHQHQQIQTTEFRRQIKLPFIVDANSLRQHRVVDGCGSTGRRRSRGNDSSGHRGTARATASDTSTDRRTPEVRRCAIEGKHS